MDAVKVENLRKHYGSVEAVRGITFRVEQGEIFGMIGPNGAGKTSTIECCLGLRVPTSGTLELLGLNPQTNRRQLFRQVGAQLQETNYQPHIRVDEVCTLISCLYDNPQPWRDLLDRYGLADKVRTRVDSLSGGQRQRLSIVLALIPGPSIVFLDELTTGLDPRARREMWEDIATLRDQGVTVIMTTHYMEEAEHLCDRVAVIDQGKIIAMDTVRALLDGSDLDHEISFSSNGIDLAALERLDGVRRVNVDNDRISLGCSSQHVLAGLIGYLESRNTEYRDVQTRSPGLEDLYLTLTGKGVE